MHPPGTVGEPGMKTIINAEMVEPARRLADRFEVLANNNLPLKPEDIRPEDCRDFSVIMRWLSQEDTENY